MRYLAAFSLILSTAAFAGNNCNKVEYAELKDMSVSEQSQLFCNYRTNFLFSEYFFNERRAVYKGNENLMTSKTSRELIEEEKNINSCKDEMGRVGRLLRERQVNIEALECKCPSKFSATKPYMRCSL